MCNAPNPLELRSYTILKTYYKNNILNKIIMKNKHTQGKWSTKILDFETLEIITEDKTICTIERRFFNDEETETHANANLIATAPQLLSVLEYVLSSLSEQYKRGGKTVLPMNLQQPYTDAINIIKQAKSTN